MSCCLGGLVNARGLLYASKPSIESPEPNSAPGKFNANAARLADKRTRPPRAHVVLPLLRTQVSRPADVELRYWVLGIPVIAGVLHQGAGIPARSERGLRRTSAETRAVRECAVLGPVLACPGEELSRYMAERMAGSARRVRVDPARAVVRMPTRR